MKAAWQWVRAVVSALAVLLIALLFYGRRKVVERDAAESIRQDRDDLRAAEETGDDAGVLDVWRRR